MRTIRERSTFSKPKKEMEAQNVCVRFGKRNQIPFIDCTNALRYELRASDSLLDMECIKNLRFSH